MGSSCLMGRISVWEDEQVLEMDGGVGCATARTYFVNATQLDGSKWLRW